MSELNFQLLKWQQKVFSDRHRFKVVAAGRRCGKSRLAAVTLIIKALEAPEGSAVLYVSPTLGQSRQIIWDLLMDIGRPVIKAAHINNMDITLVNGRKIHVRGADNPDTLRGLSLYYAVLDETAFIKPDTWEKIIRASLSDKKGDALFISTPDKRNWFYDLYKLGLSGDDEEWAAWHFTTKDNETIDPKEVEAAKRTLSTFAFKQEYEASFDNAGSDIFKPEWWKEKEEPKTGDYIVAIDLAGFSEVEASNASAAKKRLDETAIAIVKVEDDGKWWVDDIIHFRKSVDATAAEIFRVIAEYKPRMIGIEKGIARNAVLGPLETLMRQYNKWCHLEQLTHGNKAKIDRVVWSLQGKMEHGRVSFNKEKDWSEFMDQLWMFPTAGVHDDMVDALAYISQLETSAYVSDYEEEDYEVADVIAGY
jgi:predicted phage terminase large subunit-like protein